ncbi:MAG: TatD family hydrolase [bacterium]|nr:TatD family hydrolase [bacterium]
MLDIHAHLFWKSYDVDRDEVIKRAREAGVTKMICVGTEPEDSHQAIAVAEQYDGIFASVGIHPHFFNDYVEKECQIPNTKYQILTNKETGLGKMIQELKSTAQSSEKVIAIGECGLDYYSRSQQETINSQQKTIQREGFLAQIALAQELGLPLIVHTRPSVGSADAYEDVLEILKSKIINLKSAVLHCYQGDTEITKKFLELENVYFSFAGNITYPVKKALVGTKDDLTETVKLVPLERVFTETDCPFLAPQGHRGKRNEPAFVVETAQFLASLKGVSEEELNQKIIENSERVFWKDIY